MRKVGLALIFAVALAPAALAQGGSPFILCPAGEAFADCTHATCTGAPGGPYSCSCVIRAVESAMSDQKTNPSLNCFKSTDTQVQSRFAPVKYAQLCGKAFQGSHYYPYWAWCIAVLCTKTGKDKADCPCTAPPAGPTAPYGVVRDRNTYSPRQCVKPPEIWSSATFGEAQAIQHFMGAPPIVVTNPPRH